MSATRLALVFQDGTTNVRPTNFYLCPLTADFTAIATQATGDLAYDSQAKILYSYNGATWDTINININTALFELLANKNAASGYAGLNAGSKLDLVRGGTNADLSATGGASKVLQQSSGGAAITVGQLATTDISDITKGTWTPKFGASTTDGTHTYSRQNGTYIKIGKLVILAYWMQLTAKDAAIAGTFLQLVNFPFTTDSTVAALMWSSAIAYSGNLGGHGELTLQLQDNLTRCYIVYGDGASYLAPADLSATSFMAGSLAFYTA